MQTLISALKATEGGGDPLPPVWEQFVNEGIEFRRGSLHLVAAGPGVGKSVFALLLALRTGVPTLYVSADTDAFTTSTRLASAITHQPLRIVQDEFAAGMKDKYYPVLAQTRTSIGWVFNKQPTIEDLYEEAEAFAHLHGEYPHLLVVDNLMNIFSEEDDNTSLRHNSEMLMLLADHTQAAVLVLAHLTGEYDSGDVPPPLSALAGKVSKLPAVILTMFRAQSGDLGICIVKNRFGNAAANGRLRAYLRMNLEKMHLG